MIDQLMSIQQQIAESVGDPGPLREEFVNAQGVRVVYDFDSLCLDQIASATAIMEYEQALEKHPPKTLQDMERTGKVDLLLKAMSHLLVFADGDKLTPYTEQAAKDVLQFLKSLQDPTAFKRLRRCRHHFFIKTGQPVRALTEQLTDSANVMALLSSVPAAETAAMAVSSKSSPNAPDSAAPANSTDASTQPGVEA